MKRNTDVSRLRPTPTKEAAEIGAQPASCAAAVERATVLLVHGMQQSDIPISQLSGALARMAQTLSDIGGPLFGAGEAGTKVDLQVFRDAFARDLDVCIESLQFHDRLMQQLTQVRDILTALPTGKPPARVPTVPAHEGSIELF